jgi:opacity protein-like surface antigen
MEKILKGIIPSLFFLIILSNKGMAAESYKNISFKISGKYGTISLGHLNSFLSDTELYYDTLLDPHGFTKVNEMKSFKNSEEINIEFLVQLSKHFGLGLEVGYFQKSQSSDIIWESSEYGMFSLGTKPTMSCIPVILNSYLFLPLGPAARAYIKGGAGAYLFKSEFNFDEDSQIEGEEFFSTSEFVNDGNGFGLNGGIGFEFNFSSSMVFFIEGTGLFANFNSGEGHLIRMDPQGIGYKTGKAWYFEYYDENISRDLSGITYGDRPEGDEIKNVNRLKIDLSGFSIRVGIRFSIGGWE